MKKEQSERTVYVLGQGEFLILGLLLIGLGVTLTIGYGYVFNTEKVNKYGLMEHLSFETDKGGLANGFYSSSGYFCVSTKGRSVEEVTRTTVHELAHYFVDEDYEHFCKEGFS